jgi:hypothetical protein
MDVMKVYFTCCNKTAVMIDKGTIVLQNCTAFLKTEPGSSSETCPASHDENHIIDMKVEEDPVPIEFPGIKAEREVSECPCVHC